MSEAKLAELAPLLDELCNFPDELTRFPGEEWGCDDHPTPGKRCPMCKLKAAWRRIRNS